MARKSKDYWEERNTKMMLNYEKMTESTINQLIKAYNKALEDISKEITKIFNNYAKDGVLTNENLKTLLNKKQSDLYHESLLEIINTIDDSEIKKRLLAKYNAPAYAFRISRYEQLRSTIDVELKKLAAIEKNVTQDVYENIIQDGYYRTIYEIQKGTGLGFSFSEIDTRTVKLMLSENWSDRANFSERIWQNSEKLGNYMSTELLAGNLSGKSIQKMSKELSETMDVGMYQATRLIRTETNHFANESEMLAYEECDIEKYRFIATLDQVTCKHCGELDNKVFLVKDKKAGENYPPLHPNDRCTTVAVFDDEVIEELQRRARDENGNSILIPQDMNYEEWKAKHIDMTELEKGAIAEYSSSKAYTLNEKLRNNIKLDKNESELVQNIDNGLNKLPNYNKVTYRQIGFDFQGEEEYNKFINQHKNNKVINYPQYISTSKNYNDYEIDNNLKVELTIEGKTGKDIRLLAGIKEENEVVFKRDVWFEIVKVVDNKIWLKEV